jgi:hypothetical protein
VVAGKGIKRIVPLLEVIEADAAIPAEAREMLGGSDERSSISTPDWSNST